MPADAKAGRPHATPLYWSPPIPAQDTKNTGFFCMARPMGIDLTAPDVLKCYKRILETTDEKQVARDKAQSWPLPGAGGHIDLLFKTLHPAYAPFPTNDEYFLAETLGLDHVRLQDIKDRNRQCPGCAAAAAAAEAAEHDEEEGETKVETKVEASTLAKKKPSLKANALRMSASRGRLQKAESAPIGAKLHSCMATEAKLMLWGSNNERTIFTRGGTRNNLVQLFQSAFDCDFARLQVQSVIMNMAVHAWLTINGRWLEYRAAAGNAFQAVHPPYLALLYRIRDMRSASNLLAEASKLKLDDIKQREADGKPPHPGLVLHQLSGGKLADKGVDLIKLAQQAPLTVFLVVVAFYVDYVAKGDVKLRLSDMDIMGSRHTVWGDNKSISDLCFLIDERLKEQFDTQFTRMGWVFQATTDLAQQWNDLEDTVTGNPVAAAKHSTVQVAVKSTGYTAMPVGEIGKPRPYQRSGGFKFDTPDESMLSSQMCWMYTAYLPVYAASAFLRPDRPPLCTDRFYYDIAKQATPTLGCVLRFDVLMSTGGKYAASEDAKSFKPGRLANRLNRLARPDDTGGPVRARFSFVNAGESRVIPLPSLLSDEQRLAHQDPNENSMEHVPHEYFRHCKRFYGTSDNIKQELSSKLQQQQQLHETKTESFDFESLVQVPVSSLSAMDRQLLAGTNLFLTSIGRAESPSGGRVLCKPPSVLLKQYVTRYIRSLIAFGGRIDLALGHWPGSHTELVDGARVFRATMLRYCEGIRARFFNAPAAKAKAALPPKPLTHSVRAKFLLEDCELLLEVPPPEGGAGSSESRSLREAETWKGLTLDLLVQMLCNQKTSVQDDIHGVVTLETVTARNVRARLAGSSRFLPEVLSMLERRFHYEVLVPGGVLLRALLEYTSAVHIEKPPQDDAPLATNVYARCIQQYRAYAETLHPRKVLLELQNNEHKESDRLAAQAVLSAEMSPAFWALATKDGVEAELKHAAQQQLQLALPVAATAAAGLGLGLLAAPAAVVPTLSKLQQKEKIIRDAALEIKCCKLVDPSRLSGIIFNYTIKLYQLMSETMDPPTCHRVIKVLATSTELDRKRKWDHGNGKRAASEPKQKKQKRSEDVLPESAAAAAMEEGEDDDDQDMAESMSKGFAAAAAQAQEK